MKIFIDCSNLQAGGGIQVAISFINDLLFLKREESYYIALSPQMIDSFDRLTFSKNFVFIDIEQKLYKGSLNFIGRGKELSRIEDSIDPNVVFCVFGPSYYKTNKFKLVGFAIPHLIYTDSPFFKMLSFKEKIINNILNSLKQYFFIKNSSALVFESDDANTIFKNRHSLTQKTWTVNNTLNEVFLNPEKWRELDFKFDSSLNILCLSAHYQHKNLQIIPSIIDELKNKYKFKNFKFILTVDKKDLDFKEEYNQYIVFLGKIDIRSVPSLYKQVDVLLMPTLLEVFSTTYLEAMYMNVPIVSSDMGFARDICDDAALYCEPLEGKSYAEALINIKNDDLLKEKLIHNGVNNLKRFNSSLERTKSYLKILIENSKNKN